MHAPEEVAREKASLAGQTVFFFCSGVLWRLQEVALARERARETGQARGGRPATMFCFFAQVCPGQPLALKSHSTKITKNLPRQKVFLFLLACDILLPGGPVYRFTVLLAFSMEGRPCQLPSPRPPNHTRGKKKELVPPFCFFARM